MVNFDKVEVEIPRGKRWRRVKKRGQNYETKWLFENEYKFYILEAIEHDLVMTYGPSG